MSAAATALVLTLLAVTTLLTGCQATTAQEPPARSVAPSLPPLRVLLAGDSIVDGYYTTVPEHAFSPLVEASLSKVRDVTQVEVGVSGARAFRVAAAVETDTVGQAPFDVAVLEVGANDVGKSTLREWRAGFTRLLDAVAATSPDAQVVCLGPWNAQRPTRPYLDVLRRLCADDLVISLGDLFARPGLRGPAGQETYLGTRDDFHPNDAGHAAIAARVLDGLVLD